MKLVVDTNRLIAALVKDSYSRRILFSPRFDLLSIAITRRDIYNHEAELMRKSKLGKDQFEQLIDLLFGSITLIDDSVLLPFMPQARAVMDSIDPDDTPFVAAALATNADAVWTEDPHFEGQTLVPVIHTKQLTPLL